MLSSIMTNKVVVINNTEGQLGQEGHGLVDA